MGAVCRATAQPSRYTGVVIVQTVHRTSYVDRIERASGRPIRHWFAELESHRDLDAHDMVALLTARHGVNRRHASAIVIAFLGRDRQL